MSKVKLTGYDYDYYITDTGRIYKNEKLLSPVNNGLGYLDIKLWDSLVGTSPLRVGAELDNYYLLPII